MVDGCFFENAGVLRKLVLAVLPARYTGYITTSCLNAFTSCYRNHPGLPVNDDDVNLAAFATLIKRHLFFEEGCLLFAAVDSISALIDLSFNSKPITPSIITCAHA